MKRLNETTYKINERNDRVIEIGDAKQKQFYPQAKLKHWNNECNISVRLMKLMKLNQKEYQDQFLGAKYLKT